MSTVCNVCDKETFYKRTLISTENEEVFQLRCRECETVFVKTVTNPLQRNKQTLTYRKPNAIRCNSGLLLLDPTYRVLNARLCIQEEESPYFEEDDCEDSNEICCDCSNHVFDCVCDFDDEDDMCDTQPSTT